MVEIWFALVVALLAAYATLDGFDLGVGILHRILGRTAEERAQSIAAIGPFWDGNEVCLIAAGGSLLLAFPAALASALSGFYLAIFMVLWALLGRGLSIELRQHLNDPLWLAFWDSAFSLCSTLLAFLLGVALGNVVRGVPLHDDGYFTLQLFTTFSPHGEVGLLDWYTVLAGVFTTVALAVHGSLYLAWKAEPELAARARPLSRKLAWAASPLFAALSAATFWLRPDMLHGLSTRPLAWAALLLLACSGAVLGWSLRTATPPGSDRRAFLASSGLIVGVMAATACSMFPTMLASTRATPGIDAYTAAAPASSLRTALFWWPVAAVLVVVYFTTLFRHHRGRLLAAAHDE